MFIKSYFMKMCPIFVGSQLSCLMWNQKILWGCSFRCKNLLNCNYHTLKLYNWHYTIRSYWSRRLSSISISWFCHHKILPPSKTTTCTWSLVLYSTFISSSVFILQAISLFLTSTLFCLYVQLFWNGTLRFSFLAIG